MAEDYTKKLQSLLRKLFQFESADLDFGIYRIMNKKRDVIEKFIEKDLIAAVDAEFGKASMADKAQLLAEVESLAGKLELEWMMILQHCGSWQRKCQHSSH